MSTPRADAGAAQFGMIGLGVMGRNLALNIADHGFPVAVWNLETDWVDEFVNNSQGEGRQLIGTKSFEEFTRAIARPRRIMMMIAAGAPIDKTIEAISPFLEEGDILIDGGNSWFKDTQRRESGLREKGFNFFGSGVSGGETGARYGPSMMPGGNPEAYEVARPVFEAIAAKSDSGPCVAYCGPDGAGHYVKMVHNGIEYGDMQLIAEAYHYMKVLLGMEAAELADTFAEWNSGPLESFLIEVTAKIFNVKDPETSKALVDVILDKAGQKGTGKWTAQVALDLGIPVPTIAASLDARSLSSMKSERVHASSVLEGPRPAVSKEERKAAIADLHEALYASKICSYAQGMSLIRAGSNEYNWGTDLKEMARIWKAGCIIRARFLDSIMQAFEKQPALPNLLLDPFFTEKVSSAQAPWRRVVKTAIEQGLPVPAMSASIAYYDSYRSAELPQNLTQAQRDFFGAHTYQRNDDPDRGFVHTEWNTEVGEV